MTPSITQAQRDANTKAFEQGLGSYSVTMNSTQNQNQNQNQNPLSTQNHQTTFSHPYQSSYESPYHPQQHERIPTMITTELMCINRKIDRLEYAIENLPVRICQILLPKLTTPESTKKIVEEVFEAKIATLMKDVLSLRKNDDGGAVPSNVSTAATAATAATTTTTSNENVNTNPLNTGNVIKSFPVMKKAKVVAAPAPVTVLEDPSSPYKSFVWGGAVHFIPEKYSIPLCHTKQLWILWVFGDSLERIRPLRTIPRTSFCKRERTVMGKIDFVMDFFMTQIGRRYTDIVESGPENAASLFSFSYDFVFDDHKKCDTMNYIAVYNILKRRLKDSDESELDEDMKLLKKEFHDEYYE